MFTDADAPDEIELPVHHFGPSDQTDKCLVRLSASTGLNLLLAGDLAGLAPPAGVLVDDQRDLFMTGLLSLSG